MESQLKLCHSQVVNPGTLWCEFSSPKKRCFFRKTLCWFSHCWWNKFQGLPYPISEIFHRFSRVIKLTFFTLETPGFHTHDVCLVRSAKRKLSSTRHAIIDMLATVKSWSLRHWRCWEGSLKIDVPKGKLYLKCNGQMLRTASNVHNPQKTCLYHMYLCVST